MSLPTCERLDFALLDAQDAGFVLELVNEPGWLRHIGDRNIHDEAAASAYIANGPARSYAQHGFGLWRISLKTSSEAIGLCGLLRREGLPEPDIGYALLERFAGQGYISEAAAAVRDFARDTLGLSTLLALTSLDNHASIRVLEKIGFVEQGRSTDAKTGMQSRLFGCQLRSGDSVHVQRGSQGSAP